MLIICTLTDLVCEFPVNICNLRVAEQFLCLSDALLCTWSAS